tara:strand:- start:266 stop:727 length:462 start_codon:yes stop_codon:yes gene_type:complete
MAVAVFDLDGVIFDPSVRKAVYDIVLSVNKERANERYESGHFLQYDKVIDGALECVLHYEREGYQIAYLSGRRASTTIATIEALTKGGFPVRFENLHLKPKKSDCTIEFKQKVLSSYVADFENVIFFDDTDSNRAVGDNLGIPTFAKCIVPNA